MGTHTKRGRVNRHICIVLLSLWAPQVARCSSRITAQVDSLCFETCQQCLPAKYFADAGGGPGSVESDTDTDTDTDAAAAAAAAARGCGGLGLESAYLCMRLSCSNAGRQSGIGRLQASCEGAAIPTYDEVMANWTDRDVARVRRIRLGEAVGKGELGTVAVPSAELFGVWWRTLDSWAYAARNHYLAGLAMNAFWAVVVVSGIFYRLATRPCLRRPDEKAAGSCRRRLRDATLWLRRHVFAPAAFGRRRAQRVWWCTVPQRGQTLTVAAFWLLNVVFSVYGYRAFPGDMYYPSVTDQLIRQVSDRTGIIAFACFPAIWLFGVRNNLLIWLTGWDFGAWSNFHRWVARAAALQAIVHSVGYTVLTVRHGGWGYYAWWWTQFFWWTGQVATIAMSVLLGVSVYWLRRFEYETFLILHIVLSLVVLATMLGHVSIFKGQYDLLFWIPAAIWLLDRVFRAVRILSFNVRPWATRAVATYDESANIVRLSVPCATSFYKPRPGTYYYLMILNDARCWESHPFTLASLASPSSPSSKDFEEDTPLLLDGDSGQPENFAVEASEAMTFLIRPYDSFTGRLRDKTAQQNGQAANLRVLVEGPYGDTWPLHKFREVVFVVGGSGIVVALSYLQDLLADTSDVSSVQVYWAVREPRLVEDVLARDIEPLLSSERLHVDIYTRNLAPTGRGEDENVFGDGVRVHRQRLDVHTLVKEAAERAAGRDLAVVACGPARMADDARKAAVEMMGREAGRRLEFFEENFQW